jgi:hypothetical protein
MMMNENSKSTPIAQVPKSDRFSHPLLTTGKPYQPHVRALKRARIYGKHENSPTLASLMTLLNVNLENKITDIVSDTASCRFNHVSSGCSHVRWDCIEEHADCRS